MTEVVQVVADTHVFIWYVQGSPRLSEPARAALDTTTNAGRGILISAMTVVELRYLVEKGTFSESEFASFMEVLDGTDPTFEVAPLDPEIARALWRIPRTCVADPFDRMIAATALTLGQTLVSHDRRLHELSAPSVVW